MISPYTITNNDNISQLLMAICKTTHAQGNVHYGIVFVLLYPLMQQVTILTIRAWCLTLLLKLTYAKIMQLDLI